MGGQWDDRNELCVFFLQLSEITVQSRLSQCESVVPDGKEKVGLTNDCCCKTVWIDDVFCAGKKQAG